MEIVSVLWQVRRVPNSSSTLRQTVAYMTASTDRDRQTDNRTIVPVAPVTKGFSLEWAAATPEDVRNARNFGIFSGPLSVKSNY